MKFSIAPLLLLILLCGCVSQQVNVRALLDAGPTDKIYTAYNIFYSDPEDVPSINYRMAGKLLPAGTPVEVIDTEYRAEDRVDLIKFKVVSTQRVYTVTYHKKWRLEEDDLHTFIRKLLTTKSFEKMTEKYPDDIVRDIKAGKVLKGMTKEQVIMALGYPASHRTHSLDNSTWIYWREPDVCFRVIFKDDRAAEILE